MVDATTWGLTRERSRLPVDPWTGNVDILLNPDGTVVPTTLYSTPASFGLTNYGSATKLVFTQQPAGAAAGSVFLTQPVVAVEDSNGDIVASSTSWALTPIRKALP